MTDTVNGYPVVASFGTVSARATRPGRYIMVDRGESSPHRWVVAWQADGEGAWYHGNYFADEIEAKAVFLEKAARALEQETREVARQQKEAAQ